MYSCGAPARLELKKYPMHHRTAAHIAALAKNNFTRKKRTPCGTCCEVLMLPVVLLFICFLVMQYDLDDSQTTPAELTRYDVQEVNDEGWSSSSRYEEMGVPVPSFNKTTQERVQPSVYGFVSTRFEFVAGGAACEDVQRLAHYMNDSYPAMDAMWSDVKAPWNRDTHCAPGIWSSEAELVRQARASREDDLMWAAVVVRRADYKAAQLDFVIRMNNSDVPTTLSKSISRADFAQFPDEMLYEGTGRYFRSAFLAIQQGVASAFFSDARNEPVPSASQLGPMFVPMPQAGFKSSVFYNTVKDALPILLVISLTIVASRVVTLVVKEKENRQREAMYIMGLSKTAFYGAFYLTYGAIIVISSVISCAASIVIFPRTSLAILFLLYFFATLAVVSMALMVSAFFTNARLAASMASVLTVALSLPYKAVGTVTAAQAGWLCLIPHSAFMMAIETICTREALEESVNFADASEAGLSMGTCILMLVVDTALFFILACYFDAVVPSSVGAKRHPLFCLPFFRAANFLTVAGDPSHVTPKPKVRENTPASEGTAAIRIKQLTKRFSEMDRPAVDAIGTGLPDSTLTFHTGTIQVVLGHNGAGKTTLINMLTGMMRPDDGDCTVNGKSVLTDMSAIREDLGMCPQHNIIWPELTCEEHLLFFGRLKGVPESVLRVLIKKMLGLLYMAEKEKAKAGSLSGGQKRKLSVAIALIGGPAVVFLDEPTAGMDVGSRRAMWQLLRHPDILRDRSIILTTHYMDEADVLGDSVAIMEEGRLHSLGSPFYLKQKLGAGYNLTVAMQMGGDRDAVTALVTSTVEGAKFVTASGNEMRLLLPLYKAIDNGALAAAEMPVATREELLRQDPAVRAERIAALLTDDNDGAPLLPPDAADALRALSEGARAQGAFPELFTQLEERKGALGVESFGVGLVTLHEIFLKIALKSEVTTVDSPASSPHSTSPKKELLAAEATDGALDLHSDAGAGGAVLWFMQVAALLKKRVHIARRDSKVFRQQVLYPVVLVLVVSLLVYFTTQLVTYPVLTFDASSFTNPVADYVRAPPANASSWEWAPCAGGDREVCPSGWSWSDHGEGDYNTMADVLMRGYDAHGGHDKVFAVTDGQIHDADPHAFYHDTNTVGVLHYNVSFIHSVPTAFAAWLNLAYARGHLGESLTVASQPLPNSEFEEESKDKISGFVLALFMIAAFSFLPQVMIMLPVRERELQVKMMQQISGTHATAYWAANFLFDALACSVTACAATVILYAFGNDQDMLHQQDTAAAYCGLIATALLAMMAQSYAASFLFTKATTAQSTWAGVNVVIAFILVIISFVMDLIPQTQQANKTLKNVWMISPMFCLGSGLVDLGVYQLARSSRTDTAWSVISTQVTFCCVVFPAFLLLTLLLETNVLSRIFVRRARKEPEGQPLIGTSELAPEAEDVAAERSVILSGNHPPCSVVVKGLTKKFGAKVAVDNLTVGVRKGELFAFLGTNGAGKTTSISMMAGEIMPTHGDVEVDGINMLTNRGAARQRIGLCPQFDALLPELTAEEHLRMFGALRGLPPAVVERQMEDLLQAFGLDEHRKKSSSKLSGGNKRKLSVAIALIGGPAVVFLDEPSAGMDPVARRALWGALEGICKERSVLLTTHHLEEVEGLAHLNHRVSIMKDARLQCVGSLQQLKARHGNAYELVVSATSGDRMAGIREFVTRAFPRALMLEESHLRVTYNIPMPVTLSEAFGAIEGHRAGLGLSDYSITETSLEQVFLRISGEATADDEAGDGPGVQGGFVPVVVQAQPGQAMDERNAAGEQVLEDGVSMLL